MPVLWQTTFSLELAYTTKSSVGMILS
uniref:Uncharacterized protein n=1 Tax=Rhizophora mucronata TaxID=61149 RepID=A0A2P2Q0X8_RHIMU